MKSLGFAIIGLALVSSVPVTAVAADDAPSKEAVVGTWDGKVEVDLDLLKSDERFGKLSAEQAETLLRVLKDTLTKTTMSITFAADGKATGELNGPGIAAKDRPKKGTWTIDGGAIKVKAATKDDANKESQRDMVFTWVDAKTMTMGFPAKDGKEWPKGIAFKFTKK
ncbi:MAG: hypothetical protein DCC68_03835 [Planctomycetota bacterium]|nr:MAG: hypothetical protein DCC68_03835 [Planctomycetota bacterium]